MTNHVDIRNQRSARLSNACTLAVAVLALLGSGLFLSATSEAQSPSGSPKNSEKVKVIIDTDIGDDIDDAFAIALALHSPELEIVGISTAFGDTAGRAKILDRMLMEANRQDIPVVVGPPTTPPDSNTPPIRRQVRYGEDRRFAKASHPPAIDFIRQQIRRFPGQLTLVAVGPLSTVGALIDRDPQVFRQLKRVVIMGGSFAHDLGSAPGSAPPSDPFPEWNIRNDIASAQKLFRSGVPIVVMPLDSTRHLRLDEAKRKLIFSEGAPITNALTLLYHLWGGDTPVLYDPMAVAFTVDPRLCPVEPMHVLVNDKGITGVGAGAPNAEVCLRSDAANFFDYFMRRIVDTRKST